MGFSVAVEGLSESNQEENLRKDFWFYERRQAIIYIYRYIYFPK